jgi:hypothetical protein
VHVAPGVWEMRVSPVPVPSLPLDSNARVHARPDMDWLAMPNLIFVNGLSAWHGEGIG